MAFEDIFNFTKEDYSKIKKLVALKTKEKIVIIHTGPVWIMRHWQNEKWIELIKKIAQFPELVLGSAQAFEPHRISMYLMELVGMFHSYYSKHRVITDDLNMSRARLFLINGIRRVLRNGLTLLGVRAPEKM